LGQSLSALDDDALAAGTDFEEEDDGNLSADLVARANFGGFYRADDGAEGVRAMAEWSARRSSRAAKWSASSPCGALVCVRRATSPARSARS